MNTYGKLIEVESFREQAPIRKDANVVWDLGVHDISILRYLLNKNPKANEVKKAPPARNVIYLKRLKISPPSLKK